MREASPDLAAVAPTTYSDQASHSPSGGGNASPTIAQGIHDDATRSSSRSRVDAPRITPPEAPSQQADYENRVRRSSGSGSSMRQQATGQQRQGHYLHPLSTSDVSGETKLPTSSSTSSLQALTPTGPTASTSARPVGGGVRSSSASSLITDSKGRPRPERRQSSSRRLANALKPMFRRASSQSEKNQTTGVLPMSTTTGGSQSSTSATTSRPSPFGSSRSRPGSASGSPSQSPAQSTQSPSEAAGSIASASASTSGSGFFGGNRRRPWTAGSGGNRNSIYTSGSRGTPSPGSETVTQPFPSPFFSTQSQQQFTQSTPTGSYPTAASAFQFVPAGPPIDCAAEISRILAQSAMLTLAQLIPLNSMTPYGGFHLSVAAALGSLPGAGSTVSLATTALSEAATSASSIHHGQTSSSSHNPSLYPVIEPVNLPTSAFMCNEQLAATSLSLPTTSVGTVWRVARSLEWLSVNAATLNELAASRANPMTPRPGPSASQSPVGLQQQANDASKLGRQSETTFEFASLVQSVMDAMAANAAQSSIDLSCYHGHRSQVASNSSTSPGGSTPHRSSNLSPDSHGRAAGPCAIPDIHEAFVRADERGLGIAIMSVLHQVMSDAKPGASIDVGVSFALSMPAQSANDGGAFEDDEDSDDENGPILGTYLCAIAITHTFAPPARTAAARNVYAASSSSAGDNDPSGASASLPASPAALASPLLPDNRSLDATVSAVLLQHLHLTLVTLPSKPDSQTIKLTCALPQGAAPHTSAAYDPMRRRSSIDNGREPSVSHIYTERSHS